ncbi:hypothetical protein B0H14DRAFT_2860160 [Mycena olivaceomarginata]|nr:hypothetical protein B0H14DRAFT_2860137 [Mycena olivaceomarginata]KAJ7811421.1 hypothetical protein B0H14DRAFT_2860160 [Mycena olivaceomarginata]
MQRRVHSPPVNDIKRACTPSAYSLPTARCDAFLWMILGDFTSHRPPSASIEVAFHARPNSDTLLARVRGCFGFGFLIQVHIPLQASGARIRSLASLPYCKLAPISPSQCFLRPVRPSTSRTTPVLVRPVFEVMDSRHARPHRLLPAAQLSRIAPVACHWAVIG